MMDGCTNSLSAKSRIIWCQSVRDYDCLSSELRFLAGDGVRTLPASVSLCDHTTHVTWTRTWSGCGIRTLGDISAEGRCSEGIPQTRIVFHAILSPGNGSVLSTTWTSEQFLALLELWENLG